MWIKFLRLAAKLPCLNHILIARERWLKEEFLKKPLETVLDNGLIWFHNNPLRNTLSYFRWRKSYLAKWLSHKQECSELKMWKPKLVCFVSRETHCTWCILPYLFIFKCYLIRITLIQGLTTSCFSSLKHFPSVPGELNAPVSGQVLDKPA